MTPPLASTLGAPPRDDVTAWLLQVLAATTLAVGDNDLPADTQWPFLVLADIPGGAVWGPLDPARDAAAYTYQIDAVGGRPDQTRRAMDLACAAALGRDPAGGWAVDPAPAGPVRIVHREVDTAPDRDLDVEGTEPNRVWTSHARIRIHAERT